MASSVASAPSSKAPPAASTSPAARWKACGSLRRLTQLKYESAAMTSGDWVRASQESVLEFFSQEPLNDKSGAIVIMG